MCLSCRFTVAGSPTDEKQSPLIQPMSQALDTPLPLSDDSDIFYSPPSELPDRTRQQSPPQQRKDGEERVKPKYESVERMERQEHYPNAKEEKDGSSSRDSVPAHGESKEDEGYDNGMAHVKEEEEEEEEEEAPASEESFV